MLQLFFWKRPDQLIKQSNNHSWWLESKIELYKWDNANTAKLSDKNLAIEWNLCVIGDQSLRAEFGISKDRCVQYKNGSHCL